MLRRIAGVATLALAGALAGTANAQAPQEPGVTLRTYQLGTVPNALCTLKPGKTPNVDKLMPTINWTTDADFGLRATTSSPGHREPHRRHGR